MVAPGAQGGSALTVTGDTSADVSVDEESTSTVTATLTVDATPPTVQGLAGAYERKGKNHRVQLSWSGSDESGIGSYEIFRGGGYESPIATTSQSSYTDSLPRSPAASYEYQVRAIDIYGNDAYSKTSTVSTSGGDDGGGGGGNDKPCRGNRC